MVADINWKIFSIALSGNSLFSNLVIQEEGDSSFIQKLEDATASEREWVLKDYLRNIVKQILRLKATDELSDTQGFFELGMDSLMAMEFRNYLQKAVGAKHPIPNTILFEKQNINDLGGFLITLLNEFFIDHSPYITSKSGNVENSWIIKLYKNNPDIHLVCLHNAGGGAYGFFEWRSQLPEYIGLDLIQFPGRENRENEPFVDDINLSAKLIAAELATYTKPIVLFGNSMGGMIALLVAHYLNIIHGKNPQHIFCSSFGLGNMQPINVEISDAELTKHLITEYDAIPEEIIHNDALMSIFLPILRADIALIKSYDLEVPFNSVCRVSYMFGKKDPQITAKKNFASLGDVHFFEGGHLYINECQKETIAWILAKIQDVMYESSL
jgi:surfactin synthase thioesterase subunit/acyl carrier protein